MPKKTTTLIVGGGNDYLIQVKANQPKLLERIVQIGKEDKPLDTYESQDNSRGRKVTRRIEVYANSGGIDPGWEQLNRIIKVTRSGTRSSEAFNKEHYYISSKLSENAVYFAKGIRSHWGIENKLHWVKDKIMIEDDCRIRSKSIVWNLSLMRSVVISLYRLNQYNSITYAIEKFNNRISQCLQLMTEPHICPP